MPKKNLYKIYTKRTLLPSCNNGHTWRDAYPKNQLGLSSLVR